MFFNSEIAFKYKMSAVQAALGEVGRIILAKHVETCLADAIQSNGGRERRRKIEELMEIFARYCLPNGVDELGFLLQQGDAIARYEQTHS